jgi:chemotaxis protein methyltransferase CheR
MTAELKGYEQFQKYLEEISGIELGSNKHYLVRSRLNRILQEHRLADLEALVNQLKSAAGRQLRQRVVDAMTTNETQWFRDIYPFRVLTEHVLPDLAKRVGPRLRVWSAACSTGQEAYSISISVEEFQAKNPGALRAAVEIVGTDLSGDVVARAREGVYDDMAIARGLPEERRQRFFEHTDGGWRVRPALRSRVTFREMNLLDSYALLGRFDIIFCRNVLIYFTRERKVDILSRMAKVMNPQGYLLLGASEAMPGEVRDFRMERLGGGVVYRPATP